ncbi:hypothetical protein ACQ5SP_11640, partial [Rhodovulum sp. YNF3179]|uniref:hypothetical protein n=1 Tax=Rhodovulum sp. YNF3179 TaxID=3425127 RepID=UPI003D344401
SFPHSLGSLNHADSAASNGFTGPDPDLFQQKSTQKIFKAERLSAAGQKLKSEVITFHSLCRICTTKKTGFLLGFFNF